MEEEKCNQEVYENGEQVFLTHTMRGFHVEDWVVKIREESGQQVDWHYVGGRAVIRALGDINLVKQAIKNNRVLHDLYFTEELEKFSFHDKDSLKYELDGIWKYNGF